MTVIRNAGGDFINCSQSVLVLSLAQTRDGSMGTDFFVCRQTQIWKINHKSSSVLQSFTFKWQRVGP